MTQAILQSFAFDLIACFLMGGAGGIIINLIFGV